MIDKIDNIYYIKREWEKRNEKREKEERERRWDGKWYEKWYDVEWHDIKYEEW